MGFSVSTTKFVFFGLILVPSVQMVRGCGANDNMPAQPLSVGDMRKAEPVLEVDFDDYLSDDVDADAPAQVLDPQIPIAYELHPQPGENIGHYVLWTGIDKDGLMEQMGLRSPRGLRADRSYSLQLTPLAIAKFEQSRQVRITRLREAFFAEYRVKDYESYIVERGDSPDRISNRGKVPLWLVVEANRGIELGRIHPGDVIQLPVIAPITEEKVAPKIVIETPKQAPKEVSAKSIVPPKPKPETNMYYAQTLAKLVVSQKNPGGLTISVMKGESLSYLAELAKLPVSELISINKIEHPDRIKVGDQLKLPISTDQWADILKARKNRGLRSEAIKSFRRRGFEIRTVKIRQGDTLSALTHAMDADKGALAILNPSLDLDRISPGDEIRFAVRPAPVEPEVQASEGI